MSEAQALDIKALASKFVKWLISKKKALFDDNDIYDFLSENDLEYNDETIEFINLVPHITLDDSGEILTYILVPGEAKGNEELEMILRETYRAMVDNEFDIDVIEKVLTQIIFNRYASVTDSGDPKAWLLFRVASEMQIEPDEEDDRYDYQYTYTGPIYEKFGDTWIVKEYYYCNTLRNGLHGVFKCTDYRFEEPPQD